MGLLWVNLAVVYLSLEVPVVTECMMVLRHIVKYITCKVIFCGCCNCLLSLVIFQ